MHEPHLATPPKRLVKTRSSVCLTVSGVFERASTTGGEDCVALVRSLTICIASSSLIFVTHTESRSCSNRQSHRVAGSASQLMPHDSQETHLPGHFVRWTHPFMSFGLMSARMTISQSPAKDLMEPVQTQLWPKHGKSSPCTTVRLSCEMCHYTQSDDAPCAISSFIMSCAISSSQLRVASWHPHVGRSMRPSSDRPRYNSSDNSTCNVQVAD